MTASQIIDGKSIAQNLRTALAQEVSTFSSQPGLAVILVGDDAASQVYVRNKIKATEKAGMRSFEYRFPAHASQAAIASMIDTLNHDPDVHGILLQLPLPEHLDTDALVQSITSEKDVDGLTYQNMGKLIAGEKDGLIPCTPQGSLKLIHSLRKDLSGAHAVIIGRSLLFGKPMGQLLLRENCTVTQGHSRTKDLPAICRQADILIAAVGRPQMIKADWVKEGAIIIDVGINRLDDGSLVGDVDFETVKNKASAITPVPGGVGPMTIACLLENTVKAYKALNL